MSSYDEFEMEDRLDQKIHDTEFWFCQSNSYEKMKNDIAFLKEKVTNLESALKNNRSYHYYVKN
ncbi:MAG: hypothetical protein ACPKPY_09550 [Nitrososphaeraceae archaeon]